MANKSCKKTVSAIAIYAIILIVCSLAFLIIPFEKQLASWISFGFSVASIIGSLIICGCAFNGKGSLGALYGFPIFRIGVLYMIAQLASSIVICLVAALAYVPFWLSLIVSVMIMAVSMVLVILTANARNTVTEIEETTAEKIKTTAMFNIRISGIVDSCTNSEVLPKLKELDSMFKYSTDPVSSQYTEGLENQIRNELEKLGESVRLNDTEATLTRIDTVKRMLAERNRICQANK